MSFLNPNLFSIKNVNVDFFLSSFLSWVKFLYKNFWNFFSLDLEQLQIFKISLLSRQKASEIQQKRVLWDFKEKNDILFMLDENNEKVDQIVDMMAYVLKY